MKLNSPLLPNNQKILIHSFGDDLTHTGRIKGLIMDHITKIYIVELDPGNPWDHSYDCISCPEGCLTPQPK